MAYYNRVRNQKGEINKQRLRKRVERERGMDGEREIDRNKTACQAI